MDTNVNQINRLCDTLVFNKQDESMKGKNILLQVSVLDCLIIAYENKLNWLEFQSLLFGNAHIVSFTNLDVILARVLHLESYLVK